MTIRPLPLVLICAGAVAADQPYTVGMIPWMGYAPVAVAIEQGHYRALGIDVRIAVYGSLDEVAAALAAGRIQAGFLLTGSFLEQKAQGHAGTLVAITTGSIGGDKLVGRKGVDRAAAGKVGVYDSGLTLRYNLTAWGKQLGFATANKELTAMTSPEVVENLIAGRLPMAILDEPNASKALADAKIELLAATDGNNPLYDDAVIVGPNDQPARTTLFLRGYLQALAWTGNAANREALTPIINKTIFAEAVLPAEDTAALHGYVAWRSVADMAAMHGPGGRFEADLAIATKHLAGEGKPALPANAANAESVRAALKAVAP
jgi:ABC-type nitrate/sulfonate/bicarbonate transport system substrate-binding protein